MWYLWWTKWHWDRFFPEYFGLPLSISLAALLGKIKKMILFFLIFITRVAQ
jgi:hypothetical protein